jgi:hypothetical protein
VPSNAARACRRGDRIVGELMDAASQRMSLYGPEPAVRGSATWCPQWRRSRRSVDAAGTAEPTRTSTAFWHNPRTERGYSSQNRHAALSRMRKPCSPRQAGFIRPLCHIAVRSPPISSFAPQGIA